MQNKKHKRLVSDDTFWGLHIFLHVIWGIILKEFSKGLCSSHALALSAVSLAQFSLNWIRSFQFSLPWLSWNMHKRLGRSWFSSKLHWSSQFWNDFSSKRGQVIFTTFVELPENMQLIQALAVSILLKLYYYFPKKHFKLIHLSLG